MKQLRPMLAGKVPEDLDKLRLPLFASPKLDGIRCLIVDGRPLSRSLKLIRNDHIQRCLSSHDFEGLDGELIVGDPTNPNCMQHTNSGVMSYGGEPDFKFHVFDTWNRGKESFSTTYNRLVLSTYNADHITLVDQELITSVPDLEGYEADCLSAGYEGVITRDPTAPYKYNRSTTREQWLLKLKRFVTSEAKVLYAEPLQHNLNPAETDERGYTKRSAAKAGKESAEMLGALKAMDLKTHVVFNIGTGFDETQRILLWQQRASLPGRVVTYKYFAQQGVLEAPRHPVFISFRDPEDL